jgi:prepilin-type N-terminal cleavage/methylation domain-containing protein
MRLKSGFTLVEVAIVLLILGLLVGGVLQGQELVKQANIRSVISQFRNYDLAVNTFKTKYGESSIPGDFSRAYEFGLNHPLGSTTENVANTSVGNNNGNGNNIIDGANASAFVFDSWEGEYQNFWVHLSNAGLIKESFSFDCGGGGTCPNAILDEATPKNSLNVGLIAVSDFDIVDYSPVKSVNFILGAGKSGAVIYLDALGEGVNLDDSLTTEQAYSIDNKLDDGKPDRGIVSVIGGYNSSSFIADSSLSSTDCYSVAGGDYNLNIKSEVCIIRYILF